MVWKAACDGVEAGAQADVEMGEGRVHGGCDTAGARLGIAVTDWMRGGDENESSIQTDASMTEEGSSSDGNDADGSWRGLETAGIPKPGAWSRQRMSLAAIRDGKIDYGTKDGKTDYSADHPVAGLYGAIDTALATVNRLLDPESSDDEWNDVIRNGLAVDGGGVEHPFSDASRWWWAQRRFQPDSLCSGQADSNYLAAKLDDGCSPDGAWTRKATDAITNNVYWYTDATGFPIPDGLQLDSRVNPQEIVSRAYDAVLIPMDDGDWHVTVYCPATLSRPVVDRDGNEIDITRMKPGDEAYWNPASHVGVGTKQHPCQTVEVTVGGQKPFWAAVDGDYR